MNRFWGTFLTAFLLGVNISLAATFSYDSTGITKKGGKTFIVHVVDQGETLYSLSRRYSIKVDEIVIENPEVKSGLSIGQKVLVPLTEVKEPPTGAKVHEVKPSETLYSIARMYGVSTQDLKKWNKLSDNTIGVGDRLFIKTGSAQVVGTTVVSDPPRDVIGKKTHTVGPSETLYSLSRLYGVNISDLKSWNSIQGNEISVGQVLVVSSGVSEATPVKVENHSSMLPGNEEKPVTEAKVEMEPVIAKKPGGDSANTPSPLYNVDEDVKTTYENKKVVETGFAEVIEGSSDTKKYLALHRSAPVGTIMQVRNEMNNQTVFVRVVGGIPDTGNNKNVLIKISKKAFDRLGSVDSKFPVEVSFIP